MSSARSGIAPGRAAEVAQAVRALVHGVQARRGSRAERRLPPRAQGMDMVGEGGVPDVAQVDGDGRPRAVPHALEARLELVGVERVRAPASAGGEGRVRGADVGAGVHETVGGEGIGPRLEGVGRRPAPAPRRARPRAARQPRRARGRPGRSAAPPRGCARDGRSPARPRASGASRRPRTRDGRARREAQVAVRGIAPDSAPVHVVLRRLLGLAERARDDVAAGGRPPAARSRARSRCDASVARALRCE